MEKEAYQAAHRGSAGNEDAVLLLLFDGEVDGAAVVFEPWEKRDGVREEMARSRKAAAWSRLVRRGGERRPEQWNAGGTTSSLLSTNSCEKKSGTRQGRAPGRGEQRGENERGRGFEVHRENENHGGGCTNSGEQFHRPGGVGEGAKVGEWKRVGPGTYRSKDGRRQGALLP